MGASPAPLSFSSYTAETVGPRPPFLLKQQPVSCPEGICSPHAPCVNQLLPHQSMPQENILARSVDKLLEIHKNRPHCLLHHAITTSLIRCILSWGWKPQLPCCTFVHNFLFNISICCLMLYLYYIHRREHLCFCVQRPQQRSHDTKNITRVTKIPFLRSQLVTQLLEGHISFLRVVTSITRTLKHKLIQFKLLRCLSITRLLGRALIFEELHAFTKNFSRHLCFYHCVNITSSRLSDNGESPSACNAN